MPYGRVDTDLLSRALTGVRMTIESLANGFATPDDDVNIFDDVRRALGSMVLVDNVIPMGIAQTALGSLAPSQVLVSAARTATTPSADQTGNNFARGAIVVLNLTAFVTAASLTMSIQVKNADATYTNICTAAAAITALGKVVLILDPLIGAPTAEFNQTTSGTLPREWRVNVVHGNGNSHTYSVGVYPIR